MPIRNTRKFKHICSNGSDKTGPLLIVRKMTGVIEMERSKQTNRLLCVLFLVMTYLFTRGFYTPFFVSLFALLLLIVFLKEEKRLFAWMIISFFLGNLMLIYMDNFIVSFRLSPYSLVMYSQLLLLIPILIISYVIKQFKQEINPYFQKPNLTGEIQLPFSIVFSLRNFPLMICLLTTLCTIGLLLIKSEEMKWRTFLLILLFSSINALLEEVLWRGIILAKLITITNERLGIVVTSIAFGLNTTMFGFSLITSIIYIFLGLFFGLLTVKSNSIIPSIIVHTMITLLLIISGWAMIPV